MSPTTETRIATALAVALGAAAPALMTVAPIAAAVCLAAAAGIGAAYHVRTPADRAASNSTPPPAP